MSKPLRDLEWAKRVLIGQLMVETDYAISGEQAIAEVDRILEFFATEEKLVNLQVIHGALIFLGKHLTSTHPDYSGITRAADLLGEVHLRIIEEIAQESNTQPEGEE